MKWIFSTDRVDANGFRYRLHQVSFDSTLGCGSHVSDHLTPVAGVSGRGSNSGEYHRASKIPDGPMNSPLHNATLFLL